MNPHSFATWFRPVVPTRGTAAGSIVLEVPSKQFSDWIFGNYRSVIRNAVVEAGGTGAFAFERAAT